jgi:adenylosuccinate synthase
MNNLVVLGLQWGDEGKGKIVDLLAADFDVFVRFQGGANAGHTVRFADRHFALHLVPSGILHPGKICVLGNGMVVDPFALLSVIEGLQKQGVAIDGNLFLSERAQIVLPQFQLLDQAREEGAGSIGTTGRGIGPTYEFKTARLGVRACDLVHERALRERLDAILPPLNFLLEHYYHKTPLPADAVLARLLEAGARLKGYMADTCELVRSFSAMGKRILLEGAQGTLLDIDHGTYPFVTSSTCTVGGALAGSGLSFRDLHGCMGVVKAYTTRVGKGPFPTELTDALGDRLRQRGNEFGTTTGRPRRVGWLDLVALRHAVRLNGVETIALTKLDVLDELPDIQVCTRYRERGTELTALPACGESMERLVGEYTLLPGWQRATTGVACLDDLPVQAQDYVRFVERFLGVKAVLISTGPRREETIAVG